MSERRLAIEKVRQAFDFLDQKKVDEWIEQFLKAGSIMKETADASHFIRKASTFACDGTAGICQ